MPFNIRKLIEGVLRGKSLFVIHFHGDGVSVSEGKAPRSFVEDCEAIAADHALSTGWVAAQGTRTEAKLRFSGDIPDSVRQRLRNAWGFASRR